MGIVLCITHSYIQAMSTQTLIDMTFLLNTIVERKPRILQITVKRKLLIEKEKYPPVSLLTQTLY
jgi:hypothetical protein